MRRRARQLRIRAGAAFLILVSFGLGAGASRAQYRIPGDRPGDELSSAPGVRSVPEPEGFVLPEYSAGDGGSAKQPLPEVRFVLNRVDFIGNTVIEQADLEAAVAPFIGSSLGWPDLQRLRDDVTKLYVEGGYVTSGATLPDQDLDDGVLTVEIVEGRVADVDIETTGRLRSQHLKKRIVPDPDAPLNVFEIEQRLQVLQLGDEIERVQARVAAVGARGLADLHVDVFESEPLWVGAEFSNRVNPTIGALAGEVWAGYRNLLGSGDWVYARYLGTRGLEQVEARAGLPVTRWDTELSLRYLGSWAHVVDETFDFFDIESSSQTWGAELRQPIHRSPSTMLSGFLTFEIRRADSEIGLLGIGLPVPGAPDGKTNITVLRGGLNGLWRSDQQVVSATFMMSVGLDALGATFNPGGAPDGRFLSWLLQASWARRMPWGGGEIVSRFDGQFANSGLLPIEQFAIGGLYSVRGYRENTLVRDNGVSGSVELRQPIWQGRDSVRRLDLVPFVDGGYSWNTRREDIGPQTLVSVGIGVRATPFRWMMGEFYWGYAIEDVEYLGESNIQDIGIHFALRVQWP